MLARLRTVLYAALDVLCAKKELLCLGGQTRCQIEYLGRGTRLSFKH